MSEPTPMTIETRPGRAPAPPQTAARHRSIVPPGTGPGPRRRRRAAPARGSGQADRHGALRRRPRLPRRLVRRDDPLDRAHARLLGIDLDPDFDWTTVAVVTAADIPGDNVVASIADDQPILVPVGGEIRHQAEPIALLAAADRETLRAAKAGGSACGPSRCRPVFDPAQPRRSSSPSSSSPRATSTPALAEADLVVEGTYRVGHQEQLYIENNAMIAVPREDGGITVHGSLQCPYYVHKALKRGLGLERRARPRWSRRRPAAGSAARRSTRR